MRQEVKTKFLTRFCLISKLIEHSKSSLYRFIREEKMDKEIIRKIFQLEDSVIAQIIKVIQLGMLTGTDVSDYMRQFRLEESSEGLLQLTPEYAEYDKKTVEKLLSEAQEISEDVN